MTDKRKSRRKWWGRRPHKAKSYKHATAIHEFENEVILRKARELRGAFGAQGFTAAALANAYPNLFDKRNLTRALKRMYREGRVRTKGKWGRKPVYRITTTEEERAA